ncbi:MAG: 30S ribosomal protein S4 [Firmicutes bacterium]|jgi:small subunit ribosomal protein S4|nr:30S ribosomal protein S4 [Bacillota bacterium]MCR4725152.1 30S ribosomal protein S4 [Clostridia bacterium]MBQ4409424.1 30S ribosomal protein S4 [Bacillota bacterium]MBQ6295369.1 30S ribosomal protein S4 [Bacillota bacterium]MBR0051504.1 30S ribosomal protein S4 [Bacillota bacterium]
MARYTGPSCRLCRREGQKLFLKGERCYSGKCALEKRSYAPGQHGQGRKKSSDYGLQLREKQKAKRFYGLQETQFRNLFEKAAAKKGITGENLLIMLETRLDNVVFRMGLASSRKEARQLVTHGHFTVNGKKADIPSMQLKAGDVVAVKEKSTSSPKFKEIKEMTISTPAWVTIDTQKLEGKVLAMPTREQIDTPVAEHLIVELYSK